MVGTYLISVNGARSADEDNALETAVVTALRWNFQGNMVIVNLPSTSHRYVLLELDEHQHSSLHKTKE